MGVDFKIEPIGFNDYFEPRNGFNSFFTTKN